jgi:hypothetical protein
MLNLQISSASSNTFFQISGNITTNYTNVINNISIISSCIMTINTPEFTINGLELYSFLMIQLSPTVSNVYINDLTIFKSADSNQQGRIIFVCDDSVDIVVNNLNIQTDSSNYLTGTLVTSAPIYCNYSLSNIPSILINGGKIQIKNSIIEPDFRIISSNNTNDTSFVILKDFIAVPISLGNVISGKNTILLNTTNTNSD